jgi:hypothetical protein
MHLGGRKINIAMKLSFSRTDVDKEAAMWGGNILPMLSWEFDLESPNVILSQDGQHSVIRVLGGPDPVRTRSYVRVVQLAEHCHVI